MRGRSIQGKQLLMQCVNEAARVYRKDYSVMGFLHGAYQHKQYRFFTVFNIESRKFSQILCKFLRTV